MTAIHRAPLARPGKAILAAGLAIVAFAFAFSGCRRPANVSAGSAPAVARSPAAQWQNGWADGAVFYEVFVRSFADSDGDGIGDLPGLTAHLDYLNDGDPATTADLGVEALWLMPIFASPSYHGYDTTDYDAINPDYGTAAEFDAFLAAAHRRGIRVILDLMINHTSVRHPWFVESASSPTSPRRDWYVWREDDPGWRQPWGDGPTWHEKNGEYYYGIFWSGMPDLNFANPAVRAEVARIADSWLQRGVDGFRLDAARHIVADGPGEEQNDTPETHAWWREFSAGIRARHPGALLVGENWTDAATIATYYGSTSAVAGGDELPMNFDFPLAEALVDGARDGDAAGIAAALAETAAVYPPGVMDATFLTNHDMTRLATRLGGDRGKLGSAAALLLTLPGSPFLYYGEEVGLANGAASGDPAKRTPMPWDATPGGGFTAGRPWAPFAPGRATANVATQTGDRNSLLSRYRALIRARRGSAALTTGALEVLAPGSAQAGPEPVLAFVRTAGDGERALAVHNLSGAAAAAGPFQDLGVPTEPLFVDPGVDLGVGAGGAVTVSLPPFASGVWRLAPRRP